MIYATATAYNATVISCKAAVNSKLIIDGLLRNNIRLYSRN